MNTLYPGKCCCCYWTKNMQTIFKHWLYQFYNGACLLWLLPDCHKKKQCQFLLSDKKKHNINVLLPNELNCQLRFQMCTSWGKLMQIHGSWCCTNHEWFGSLPVWELVQISEVCAALGGGGSMDELSCIYYRFKTVCNPFNSPHLCCWGANVMDKQASSAIPFPSHPAHGNHNSSHKWTQKQTTLMNWTNQCKKTHGGSWVDCKLCNHPNHSSQSNEPVQFVMKSG